jgi:hypothetical protein
MKKNSIICVFAVLLLCSGCAPKYLTPLTKCQPLSTYHTIVLTPFDADSARVEESKYIRLPHSIARTATERLKDQLEFYYLFPKVIQSSACMDQAVKIEGKIIYLYHTMGYFHVGVRGRLIDCQTNKPLYIFEHEEEDSNSVKLPVQFADNLFEGIKDRLTCE